MKVHAVTSLSLILLASAAVADKDASQKIHPRSSCNDLKYKQLHLNQCQSAYNMSQQIINRITKENLLQSNRHPLIRYAERTVFTYYEHLPDANSTPAYSDQTPEPCENAFKTPGTSKQNPLEQDGDFVDGGSHSPLCNLINYVQTVGNPLWQANTYPTCSATTSANHSYKCSGSYFNALTHTELVENMLTSPNNWRSVINSLGAYAYNTYIQSSGTLGTPKQYQPATYYSPNKPYYTATNNKPSQPIIPNPKHPNYAYYGISGGGGSGAGFEVNIIYNYECYKENKAHLNTLGLNDSNCKAGFTHSNNCTITAFSGGFGGGGGMTSSRWSTPTTVSIGGGGGGGAQFNLGHNQQGASIGAGSNLSPTTTPSPLQWSINQAQRYISLLNNFSDADSHYLTNHFTRGGLCVNHFEIQGGGGMGAGLEVIGANNNEYTPHPYSSSGGFQFTTKLYPILTTADNTTTNEALTTAATINQSVSNFYIHSGNYWKKATTSKITRHLATIAGGSWDSCPLTMSNLQTLAIYCMAVINPSDWGLNKPTTLQQDQMTSYMYTDYMTATDRNPKCNPHNIPNFTQKNYPVLNNPNPRQKSVLFEKCSIIAPKPE